MKWTTVLNKFFVVFVTLALYGCSSAVSKDTLVGKWEYTEAYFEKSENGQIDIAGKYIEFSSDGSYCLSSYPLCGSYQILDNGRLELSGPDLATGEMSSFYSNVHELDAKISGNILKISTPKDYRFDKYVVKLKKLE